MPVPGRACEVVPGQEANASAFMEGLVGGAPGYAAALGANFSALIASDFGLAAGGATRRAFWINPAVIWRTADAAGSGRFTLSQVVMRARPPA